MKFKRLNMTRRSLFLLAGLLLCSTAPQAAERSVPKGVMLNPDFQNIKKGLIPNKTLYPLYIPLNDIGVEKVANRNVIMFKEDLSLDIPHSSLLEPTEDTWVVTIRLFAVTNGIVMSQCNEDKGYVIYLKDNELHVAIRSGYSTVDLHAAPDSGESNSMKRWVTVELRIKRNSAILSLNRVRVDLVALPTSFTGSNYKIRFGQHEEIPAPFKQIQPIPPDSFTGAISSIKMLRQ